MRRVVIEASAGSGKTFQLSSAYLALLLDPVQEVRVSDLLATTFTRKAAGEIQSRVLERLANAAASEEGAQALGRELFSIEAIPDREWVTQRRALALLAELVSDFSQMKISTLDGVFGQIANAMGPRLGFPANWRLADEIEVKKLRRSAWRAVLLDWENDRLVRTVRALSQKGFTRSVSNRLEKAVQEGIDLWRETRENPEIWGFPGAPVRPVTPDRVQRVLESWREIEDNLPLTKAGKVNSFWRTAFMSTIQDVEKGEWKGVLVKGITGKVREGEFTFRSTIITDEFSQRAQEILELASDAIGENLHTATREQLMLSIAAGERYESDRFERGMYGFSDITEQIERGLAPDGSEGAVQNWLDVYYRLDRRIRHLLIDEFQDTSRSQLRILWPIIEEICSSDERSLLIVGDAKQSIYGWRGGERELLAMMGEYVSQRDGKRIPMSENWRSSQTILDVVNTIFTNLGSRTTFSEYPGVVDGWAYDAATNTSFPRHEAAGEARAGGAWLHFADRAVGEAEAIRAGVGDKAVEVIRSCLEQTSGVVAVLFRARAGMASLAANLRAHGIDCSFEAGGTVCDSQAVLCVDSLLGFMMQPGDTGAMLMVAQSPLGERVGITCESVFASDAERGALARVLRNRCYELGVGQFVADLCRDFSRTLCPAQHERDRSRLAQLGALGMQFDGSVRSTIGEFLEFIRDVRVPSLRPARVRLLTIHQSKGLEFDTVVLPDLERGMTSGQAKLLTRRANPMAPLDLVCTAGTKESRRASQTLEDLYEDGKAEQLREELSIFYVAATRAKHFLHFVIAPAASRHGKLSPASLLREIYARSDGQESLALVESAPMSPFGWKPIEAQPVVRATSTRIRLADKVNPASPSESSGNSKKRSYSSESILFKRLGIQAHEWLSQLHWLDSDHRFDVGTPRLALTEALAPERADSLWQALTNAIQRPSIRDRLSRGALSENLTYEVHNELPYVRRTNDSVTHGVIDRVVVARNLENVESIMVMDFKSAGLMDPVPLDATFWVERYRSQIVEYAAAVRVIFGLDNQTPVRGGLILLGCGEYVEIEVV